MTKEEFITMVRLHDLTFMYSDDSGVRSRGYSKLGAIKEAAESFDRAFVIETWNAKVDRVLAEGYRKEFYWEE